MTASTVAARGRVAVQRIEAIGQRTRRPVAVFAPLHRLHAVRVGTNVGSSWRLNLLPNRLLPSEAPPLNSGFSSRGQWPLSAPASLDALGVHVGSHLRSATARSRRLGRFADEDAPAALVRPCWHFSPTLSKKCAGLRGIMITFIKDRISTTDDRRKRDKRVCNGRRAPIMVQPAPIWLPGAPIRGGTTRLAEKSLWTATAGARPRRPAPWLSTLRRLRHTSLWLHPTGGARAERIRVSASSPDPKSAGFATVAARVHLVAERPPSLILFNGDLFYSLAACNRRIPLARTVIACGCALAAAASRRARQISTASILASVLTSPRPAEGHIAPSRTPRFTCRHNVVVLLAVSPVHARSDLAP